MTTMPAAVPEFMAPEPVRATLAHQQTFFVASPTMPDYYAEARWHGDTTDQLWLSRGLVHLTRGNAIAHAMVMLGRDPLAW